MTELFGVEISDLVVNYTGGEIDPMSPSSTAAVVTGAFDADATEFSAAARAKYRADPVAWARDRVGVQPWSKQREMLEAVRDHRRVVVHSCHDVGKGLALDTPIPTPTGWTTMGDIHVGTRLIDESGNPCTVVYASPVRRLDCYEIRFSNGETIVCDGDHLWQLIPASARRPAVDDWRDAWDRSKTVGVRELDIDERYRLPITRPLAGVVANLPIDPYLLGAWLGDGNKHQLTITVSDDDREILDRCVERSGWETRTVKHAPRRIGYKPLVSMTFVEPGGHASSALRSLGVWAPTGAPSAKHIPVAYLRAPVSDRRALLAGLMDTDGTVSSRSGQVSITQTNETLARDIYELVVSLGINASYCRSDKYVGYLGRRVASWTTTLYPDRSTNPFMLRRKAERVTRRNPTSRSTAVVVQSVTKIESVPTRCVTVDSPRSLYLAGRSMLPTHNTWTAALATAWWIDVHPPGTAFVVTTAPTGPQVRALLWREINDLHERADLPGRTNQTEWFLGRKMVAFGRKPSEYNTHAFQGIHQRFVLVVMDEACGVPDTLWTAGETIAANEHSHILAIGNPDTIDGQFARKCEDGSGWHVVHIGYQHTPNFTDEDVSPAVKEMLISPTWVEERRTDWGEDSALFQSKVLGEFPTNDADPWTVVPLRYVAPCRNLELPEGEPVEGGIDVGAGGDRTVLVERRGRRAGRVGSFRSGDGMASVGQLVEWINEWGLDRVKVDVIGVGYGVYGRLRELSSLHNPSSPDTTHDAEVVPVSFAEASAQPKRFLNRRAEVWWSARERSRLQTWDLSALDDDAIGELTAPRYEIVDSHGKIKIESKTDVIKRLKRSPDIADALLLAFYDGATGGPSTAPAAVSTFQRASITTGPGTSLGRSPFGNRQARASGGSVFGNRR